MKCVFAVLCIFVVMGYAYCVDLQFLTQMKECGNEMGFTPEQLMDMIAKNDPQMDCIRACVLEKLGALSNGHLDKGVLLAMLDQNKDSIPNYDQMRENVETCYGEATSGGLTDQCQLGGKFSVCMKERMAGLAGLVMNGASQLSNIAHSLNSFGRSFAK